MARVSFKSVSLRGFTPRAPERQVTTQVTTQMSWLRAHGPSKLLGDLVDLVGIEPTTSSMPWKRAPSCATGPHEKRCTRGLKQFNSRLLAIDSQTLWRLFASLSARQILGSGSVRTRRPHQ